MIEEFKDFPATPGNDGGETLRQYCGLSARRENFGGVGISAQRLYIAIGNAKKRARSGNERV